jgi:hypothetical protein
MPDTYEMTAPVKSKERASSDAHIIKSVKAKAFTLTRTNTKEIILLGVFLECSLVHTRMQFVSNPKIPKPSALC